MLLRRFSPLDNPSKLDCVANDRGWLANRSAVSKPQCPEVFLHARYFAETSTITALGMRSSAERHQLAIGLVLTFVGLAAVGDRHARDEVRGALEVEVALEVTELARRDQRPKSK